MRACSHIAERSLSYAKDNASEHNESLLSHCRAQLILCKDNASERNESLLLHCRAQLILCKNKQNISYAEIISHKNNRTTTLCKQLLKNN